VNVQGRADFHVRHGAGVRQFIEVAQKLPEKCQQTAMEVR
jgi:predicted type IV restriction endonuclease